MDSSTSSHNPHLYWRKSVAFLIDDVDGGYRCFVNLSLEFEECAEDRDEGMRGSAHRHIYLW